MSDSSTIIHMKEIYKSYTMGTSRVRVLKGIDLKVSEGEFLAVVGASGSGKTTLLHLLGTLDKPDSGTIDFRGKDLAGKSGSDLNRFRNSTIGFVFQFYHLLDELNVLENVLMPAMISRSPLKWLANRQELAKRGEKLLKDLGLASRVKYKPYQLSGGERQRTALARALINAPELLLADEPTGNLDSETGNAILEILESLNRSGQTIVMVTHDSRIAERASRIITLTDGRLPG